MERLLYLGAAVTAAVFAAFVTCKIIARRYSRSNFTEERPEFVDPKNRNKTIAAPSITAAPTCLLSVVVPAYNEEERIREMMDETLEHLQQRNKKDPNFTFEVIVVDDRSADRTFDLIFDEYIQKNAFGCGDRVRLTRQPRNRGKGAAVRRGVYASSGEYIIFADADAATKFGDLDRLLEQLRRVERNGTGIGCGSRAHLEETDAVAKRSFLRNFLMHVFHFAVSFTFFTVNGRNTAVKDTQCGFKLLTRASAAKLFPLMHFERWSFDVELLILAERFHHPVVEVPVNWSEKAGSKLTVKGMVRTGLELFLMSGCYRFSIWSA
eukprot:TRINITY_DN56534_c0_g1_i1.p1 TRINITY_DN56534_c0_g1~~TRINITY_DN56534_c0_g1_i1.p1  ORF type:complete len:323 (+),score=51.50 TRINITY_DN56534_c0_g1_i1:36-1004(+)